MNPIALEVWEFKSAAEAQKNFSNREQDSDDAIGSQKPLPESGLPSHDRMRGLMLTALSR
jgi:hypothetical protein